MLPKIIIRLSILALCFIAMPAYADWFNLEKVNFLQWTIDFIKEHWLLSFFAVLCILGYFFIPSK